MGEKASFEMEESQQRKTVCIEKEKRKEQPNANCGSSWAIGLRMVFNAFFVSLFFQIFRDEHRLDFNHEKEMNVKMK